MSEKKPRRVVSKAKYAKVQARRIYEWIGLIYSSVVAVLLIGGVFYTWVHHHSMPKILGGLYCLSLAGVMYFAIRSKIKQMRTAEPVVPLTRANIVHLPASDSLVRASSEPVHDQQTELLRAAVEAQATPAEQLLRPANEI